MQQRRACAIAASLYERWRGYKIKQLPFSLLLVRRSFALGAKPLQPYFNLWRVTSVLICIVSSSFILSFHVLERIFYCMLILCCNICLCLVLFGLVLFYLVLPFSILCCLYSHCRVFRCLLVSCLQLSWVLFVRFFSICCYDGMPVYLMYLLNGFFPKWFVEKAPQPKGVYPLKNLVPTAYTVSGVVNAMLSCWRPCSDLLTALMTSKD